MKTAYDKKDLEKVLHECRLWGVPTIATDDLPGESNDFFQGPQLDTTIEWPKRTIWYDSGVHGDTDLPNMLLHEMAHCLMELNPNHCEEVDDGLFALDWFTTRRLRLHHRAAFYSNFYIGDFSTSDDKFRQFGDWSGIGTRDRHTILQHSLECAVYSGLMRRDGTPTYRRPRWAR